MTTQPLTNKRIVVTRPRGQADELGAKLAAFGAHVILFPVIEIAPLEDYSALDAAIRVISSYDWIIFTSVNGVEAFWTRCEHLGFGNLATLVSKAVAIGPATAAALQSHGVQPALIPQHYVAEGITSEMGDVAGQRILWLRAELARAALLSDLRARGATVEDVPSYRTIPVTPGSAALSEIQGGVDLITFTSSSAVNSFADLIRQSKIRPPNSPVACLGPITAATAHQAGFTVTITATTYATDGLVSAIVDYYNSDP